MNCATISSQDFILRLFKTGVDVRYFVRTCASMSMFPPCENVFFRKKCYIQGFV